MSVTMFIVDELRMRFLSSKALLCRKDGVESLLLTADQVGIHDQFTLVAWVDLLRDEFFLLHLY